MAEWNREGRMSAKATYEAALDVIRRLDRSDPAYPAAQATLAAAKVDLWAAIDNDHQALQAQGY